MNERNCSESELKIYEERAKKVFVLVDSRLRKDIVDYLAFCCVVSGKPPREDAYWMTVSIISLLLVKNKIALMKKD